ncbi:DUF58 domain-containing protein [Stieleria sp. TO1_6]|uniref:DUF58 domain-containing protein n=1 Tax=Stieleria tagensis TaxID=2956795 RepID=UPI00209ABCF6|nr:DUF58 domain-containing protein [Stieleria tagensis]MCO8122353.1 DUF58 domain-containing protein [Stieleria tagensis]
MAARQSKPLYRYRLTRLGFHFLFVALFAMIGGSLRGFNLLLVLAGLLVGVVIVQWRQGRSAIRRTRLRRLPSGGTFAGHPLSIRYEIRNASRWLPLWMIRVEDSVTNVLPLTTSTASHQQVPMIASVGSVPAGQIAGTSIICRFSQRGVYQLGPLIASTSFPFSLLSCERLSPNGSDRVYIYPRRLELRRGWQTLLPPRRGGDGNRSTGGNSQDGEFFGLRPWQSGDHVKHIHWRTSARIGGPAVRQFEQRNRHQICVVVDAYCGANGAGRRDLESVLEFATTVLCELSTQTHSVALLVADGRRDTWAGQSQGNDVSGLLERLTIVPSSSDDDSADSLSTAVVESAARLRRYDLVVVSCRPFADVVGQGMKPGLNASGRSGIASIEQQGRAFWRHFHRANRLAWLNLNSPLVQRFLHDEDVRPIDHRDIAEATRVSH